MMRTAITGTCSSYLPTLSSMRCFQYRLNGHILGVIRTHTHFVHTLLLG